jgi:hypothetical protein
MMPKKCKKTKYKISCMCTFKEEIGKGRQWKDKKKNEAERVK